MDALALLCNLHASGPATLDRLRHLGVDTLPELAEIGPDVLVERLSWERARVERFLREGELLARRLDVQRLAPEVPGGLEPSFFDAGAEDPQEDSAEDIRQAEVKVESTTSSALHGEHGEHGEQPSAEAAGPFAGRAHPVGPFERSADEQPIPADSSLSRTTRPSILKGDARRRVLGTWRELDEEEAPAVLIPQPPLAEPERSGRSDTRNLDLSERTWLAPELADLLRRVGAVDLRALADSNAFELSDQTGLGYTRVLRLQGLARRDLSSDR